MAILTVFVTVGTTQFNSLVRTITSETNLKILHGLGCRRLIIQIGRGDFEPPSGLIDGIEVEFYRFKDNIGEDIQTADLVISHAGAGSCLETLRANKKLLVVVNEELMDNHQVELAQKFAEEDYLLYTNCSGFSETIKTMNLNSLKPYSRPNTSLFSKFLDEQMGF